MFFPLLFQGPFATFNLPQGDAGVELTGIKFSNDGKKILVPTTAGTVHLLDAFQGNLLHTFGVCSFCCSCCFVKAYFYVYRIQFCDIALGLSMHNI